MRPNAITSGTPQKMKVLNPYRNPGEANCFILGVEATAIALGHMVRRYTPSGSIPTTLELMPVPPPEPVVTIEIPEEDPMLIEDKPVKKVKLKKKVKRAKPDEPIVVTWDMPPK